MKNFGWKKMKNSTKISLATSAVYAASALAIPVFANQTKEIPVVQPLNLEQVTTVEQVDNLYKEKLVEYAADKKLTAGEISDLDSILGKKDSFIDNKMDNLQREYSEIVAKKRGIETEIDECRGEIEDLRGERKYTHPDVKGTKDAFDKKIISHYPSLLEKEANITYSAETKIKPQLVQMLKEMIIEIHEVQVKFYQDDSLEILSKQQEFTISDLVAFNKVLNKKRPDICFNEKEIESKQNAFREKQAKLEKQLEVIINSEGFRDYSTKQGGIHSEGRELRRLKSIFSDYLSVKEKVDNFHGKDLSRYVGISVYYLVTFEDKHEYYPNSSFSPYDSTSEINDIERYFKSKNLEVEVEKLKNPTRTKIPNNVWMLILGFAFPIIRNNLVRRYVGRFDGMEGDDYGFANTAGIFNCCFGTFLLDHLHPAIWWFRMIGTPLIIQPIEKLIQAKSEKGKKK